MSELEKKFFEEFPEYTTDEYACFADDYAGDLYCVWDNDKPEDCSMAIKGIKKENCPHWKKKEKYLNLFSTKDIWEWMEKNIIKQEDKE